MKNRIFVALVLSAIIALPAWAQQSSQGSSSSPAASADQTAPQNQTATGETPLHESKTDYWEGEEPGLAALLTHPFASKGWVRRHTDPIRDRLNELDEITAEHGRSVKDIDARSQQGIQLASEKENLADQHAADASSKSQTAQQAASDASSHVSRVEGVVGNIDQYKATGQTVIQFRPGQTALSEQAKRALDDMAAALKNERGYVIEVRGFSAGRGQAAIASSQKMGDAVVRYLVLNHEIPAYRIFVLSMGNVAAAEGTAAKGSAASRIEVNVLKNGIDQLASTAAK